MSPTVQLWMSQLESLPADDREMLAHVLLESIEPFADEDVASAWNRELRRRISEIEVGTAIGIDGDEFLAALQRC